MTLQVVSVVGAGSWGTALAWFLANQGHSVRLWARRPALARKIQRTRKNADYLPGLVLPENVAVFSDPLEAVEGVATVLCVVPSHHVRTVFESFKPNIRPDATIVSATKGIENETCLLMSEVLVEVLGAHARPHIAALSGPSFSAELVRGDPTTAVIAAADSALAAGLQESFSGANFRLYTNTDLVGTQIGGAVKNVIAIAAGIIDGLGFGYNTAAALITRGLAELKRLCVAAGGQPETLSGLAGLGDLVLTTTGTLSRNRSLGVELGRGKKLPKILAQSRFVAEGVRTTLSTYTLARRLHVEMPITAQMHAVLYAGKAPMEAIRDLMERELKSETGEEIPPAF